MSSRACVYLDMRNEDGDTRTLLRICGPNTTIGSLQHDAEICARYEEFLGGIRVFFEDPLVDPKQEKRIVVEEEH